MAKMLIIDDQEPNRLVLGGLMDALHHEVVSVSGGEEGLAVLEKEPVDLVFLDIMMPGMDGYQVLDVIKANEGFRHIPVIMITAISEIKSVVRCIEAGADDYLVKPFNATLLKARVASCLDKKRVHDQETYYRQKIEDYNLELESRVKEQVAEISSTQMATIFAMSKLAESRDPETGEHLERMREYARVLASTLADNGPYTGEIDADFIDNIYAVAPLHDIGKVGIPDRILQKPGKLTPEEFDLMKLHPTIGAETLCAVQTKHISNKFIKMGIEVAESHHEKWTGGGYPHGLTETAIPLAGRILALGDVYDALTSKRCYKEAFSHEKSRAIILEERGRHFDPFVVDAFVHAEPEFIRIREAFQDNEKKILF